MNRYTSGILIIIILFAGYLIFHHKPGNQVKALPSSPTATASPSSSLVSSVSPSAAALQLQLPFSEKNAFVKAFGLYPFGVVSSEHPEGHAGINFEVQADTIVVAPADLTVTTITSPAGRPDEHNLLAQVGDQYLEFLRVGKLATGVQVGTKLKQGEPLAVPGANHSLNTTMFHMGILNSKKDALCPDQSFWSADAWQQLQGLLHTAKETFASICVSTIPISAAKRGLE